jgi:DnaK suppressor protein
MTKTELNQYSNVLDAKQKELVQVVRNRDGIAIEKCPDAFDDVQYATERELASCNLARESSLLSNVLAALRRIEEGRFGVCLRCEEGIGPKRLAAVPWAAFCIDCQEIADSGQGANAGSPDWLVNAA